MKLKQLLILIAAVCLAMNARAQRPTPALAQSGSMLITGGTVHLGNGKTLERGAVGFRNGVIDYVGFADGVTAKYDKTIDFADKHVYPGFILADNTLGLAEIDQVRASRDEREPGTFEPEVRALSAYNADSRITPTVRSNGVLLAQITPRGNRISGTSSVVQLDAWDWEDAAVKTSGGVHVNWPRAYDPRGWWAEPAPDEKPKADKRKKQLTELHDFFEEAQAYAKLPIPAVVDVRMESMRGIFDATQTLYVHANRVREIQEALLFKKEMGVDRMVIVGGYDAWRIPEQLKDRNVPVILRRVHSLPLRQDDPVNLPYRLPALLHDAGVDFCLSYTGDMERMGSRNLAFTAGTAAAYGLDKEVAVQKITLDAARVLGIDKTYGSLEIGKSATLFVSMNDALDMRNNNVEVAFIDGRTIDLGNHQVDLWERYRERYKGVKK